MLYKFSTLITVVALLSSCVVKEKKATPMLNGIWESIGSGWIIEIEDSTTYTFYDITSISCLTSRQGELHEIQESLTIEHDTLSMTIGVIPYTFKRITHLPVLCSTSVSDEKRLDPLFNFEVFAETVQEHYAFMELNKIEWEQLYNQQKEKLNKNPSDVELYLIIEETLELLNDNHAYLEGSTKVYEALDSLKEEKKITPKKELPEYGDIPVATLVTDNHLIEDMTKDSRLIQWGKMTNDIGFIQVKTMWLHADLDIPQTLIDSVGFVNAYIETRYTLYEGEYIKEEVEAVNRIMGNIMEDLAHTKSIVIDVRFNGGGQDAVSYEILRHLTKSRLQFASQKLKHGNGYSPITKLFVEGSESAYTKPVYVLTSPQTGSAAESFCLATMELQNVTRIGTSTMGALSTTLDKTLPNGWNFSISNEIYMDNDGVAYENIGIPVNHELNYPKERQSFFRSVVNDLSRDKEEILRAIQAIE